jgi:hypothetical protein
VSLSRRLRHKRDAAKSNRATWIPDAIAPVCCHFPMENSPTYVQGPVPRHLRTALLAVGPVAPAHQISQQPLLVLLGSRAAMFSQNPHQFDNCRIQGSSDRLFGHLDVAGGRWRIQARVPGTQRRLRWPCAAKPTPRTRHYSSASRGDLARQPLYSTTAMTALVLLSRFAGSRMSSTRTAVFTSCSSGSTRT